MDRIDRSIDYQRLLMHKNKTRSVTGFEAAKEISNEELLALECGILVSAALANQMTRENAAIIFRSIDHEETCPDQMNLLRSLGKPFY